jgi:hypothetical protein
MYYKIINDRTVFSNCKTIQTNDGAWISNPSAEQIADAGWQVYIPPVIPPEPQTEPDFEEVINAVKKFLSTSTNELSDEDALVVAALYPTWASKIGKEVVVGERLWYNGKLYKIVQDHTIQEDWKPDTLPALYTEVSIEEIPEWIQPVGSTGLYMLGDKVKHNNKTWESEVDNNSWEPGVYGWKEV